MAIKQLDSMKWINRWVDNPILPKGWLEQVTVPGWIYRLGITQTTIRNDLFWSSIGYEKMPLKLQTKMKLIAPNKPMPLKEKRFLDTELTLQDIINLSNEELEFHVSLATMKVIKHLKCYSKIFDIYFILDTMSDALEWIQVCSIFATRYKNILNDTMLSQSLEHIYGTVTFTYRPFYIYHVFNQKIKTSYYKQINPNKIKIILNDFLDYFVELATDPYTIAKPDKIEYGIHDYLHLIYKYIKHSYPTC